MSYRNGLARTQRGVVLVIALVVLVAMSLGGVAIMRSVDTATLIAGNLAFKQRTIQGANIGLEHAIKWIADNKANLNVDNFGVGGAGYYSASSTRFAWETASSWNTAKVINNGNADAAGNVVSYVIHRLCNIPGVGISDTNQLCGFDAGSGGANFEKPTEGSSASSGGTRFTAASKLYLRIIVRSLGPRNSVSYIQGMVLITP